MFFNKKNIEDDANLVKIGALLIHTAKIDENYSQAEEEIIRKTLVNLGAKQTNLDTLITRAKQCESDANQILDFTKEIKNLPDRQKLNIIEALWSIIYSDKDADMYETGLMRKLAGLLYIDSKTMGDIKDKIKKKNI